MKSLLAAALSCFLSLLLFRFVIATTSPEPAPAPAAVENVPPTPPPATATPTATQATLPSLLGSLFSSPVPRSPLSALYVTRPTLPTRPLSENGCIFKSVTLANDCRFAFDAMQSVESGSQLETALAISRATRQVGAAAAARCSEAARAFYGEGCACEPAVVLGLKFVDVVPPRAKEELLKTASKCPAAAAGASPGSVEQGGGGGSGKVSLADALSLLSGSLESEREAPSSAPASGAPPEVRESAAGGAPLRGL